MKKLLALLFLMTACSTPVGIVDQTPTVSSVQSSDPCNVNGQTYCVLNPDVTQDTIGSTICVSGWTKTIRPPVSYTEPIKLQLINQGQNLVNGDTNPSDYELDHRMPLELGGAPSDTNNLSIEYPRSPNPKDSDENNLRQQVCNGSISLRDAQIQLINKWLGPYPEYKN